ncbi:Sodium/hydrogen exchanger family [Musa troglodytarum]|uniref:Sodium/hydrogen exchanger family n=1 Tax=Musa troglodytarum TaxID=320322 RepID=A0A9E7HDT3_9LILI|nr:Sodium/hydrogen exchanger family [Musa troglodytarum]
MVLVVAISRGLAFLLKPLRQPRVIAEILVGISPEGGKPLPLGDILFPPASYRQLEAMSTLGIIYYIFLIGAEFDIQMVAAMGKKVVAIATVNMAVPIVITVLVAHAMNLQPPEYVSYLVHVAFIGAAWIMLSAIGLWLICWLVVLPIMNWTVQRTPEGEAVSDAHITIVATGVLAAGLIADVIGFPSVFGAFVFGLLMPQGALTTELRNKLEDFVVGLLLPIYFGASGFKSNVSVITMDDKEGAAFVAALTSIMVLCFVAKLGSNLLIAQYYSLPASRGLSLGLLMNAKGSVEMIILNIGKQKGILDERTYTMMVLGSILTTAVVGPVLEIFNKTSRSRAAYKRRNLQQCRPDSELRMVACVYTARNVPSIISLLQMSNPTKRSPVFVYVVHLLELTGRGAAMMIVQQASSKHSLEKVGSKSSGGALQADQIIAPFQSYEQQAGGVSVQRVTAVSPYSTMDEDIFNIAEERHTTIIVLLPQTAIGGRGLRGGRPGHPQRQHERPGPLALHRVHPRRPRDQRGREVLRGPARAAPRGGPLLRRARRPRGADVLVADGGASRCHPHRYPVPAGRGGHGASEPRSLMRVRWSSTTSRRRWRRSAR